MLLNMGSAPDVFRSMMEFVDTVFSYNFHFGYISFDLWDVFTATMFFGLFGYAIGSFIFMKRSE